MRTTPITPRPRDYPETMRLPQDDSTLTWNSYCYPLKFCPLLIINWVIRTNTLIFFFFNYYDQMNVIYYLIPIIGNSSNSSSSRVWLLGNDGFLVFFIATLTYDDRIFYCLLTSMAAVQVEDVIASFLFVGDLNGHHREWLASTTM